MSVPIGVIGMIYESRPHVTVNAGALCIKSGNAAVLRGGSEVINTNRHLGELWEEALQEAELPGACVQVITVTDRAAVRELLSLDKYVDLIIPRGGEGLINTVVELARMPVIKHLYGICHVYVDARADLEMALRVCLDSKIFAPEVCNAAETFLVSEEAAEMFLPDLAGELKRNGVEIKGCERTRELVEGAEEAVGEDWATEYLDLVVSIRVVADVEEAIEHINHYGSGHTESIVSDGAESISRFLSGVDSGVVLVNASTMYCDGSELGMGAEIGISTDKIHARGPMGIKDLTTYKTVVFGKGHCMG
ncbi:MAG: glutamate-5-semialdehyde dehydrogenase, partial [Actinomycetota bacterium]